MNEQDKAAYEQAAKKMGFFVTKYHNGDYKSPRTAEMIHLWQAALEYARSGEPVAWLHEYAGVDKTKAVAVCLQKISPYMKFVGYTERPLFTHNQPAVAVNEQLLCALTNLRQVVRERNSLGMDWMDLFDRLMEALIDSESAIEAGMVHYDKKAEAAKGGE